MKRQTALIAGHLKRHKSITPMQALNQYGCFRLAARVKELREERWSIHTDMSEGYATYRLERAGV